MEHVQRDAFKPQHYLIKSIAALTLEHVIGPDRAKSKGKQPSLPPPLGYSLHLKSPAETLSDSQVR